ncbi:MAG: hypothetical protein U9P90_02480 [Patescibacteria group bacterium]|nr:hypothetical protein [Patescibacteria group bacterium]
MNKEKACLVNVEVKKGALWVNIKYWQKTPKRHVDFLKGYYQWKFSREHGEEIPIEEISVSAKEGELMKTEMTFIVQRGAALYLGLYILHYEAPHVIPVIIKRLKRFKKQKPRLANLTQYAIDELKKITEKTFILGLKDGKRVLHVIDLKEGEVLGSYLWEHDVVMKIYL